MTVNFIQDNTFLRTPQKTNPFFDPIIKVCEENGIEWKVWLPSRPEKCGYGKSHIGCYGLFRFVGIWFWRVVHCFSRKSVWQIYEIYGRCVRVFFRNFLRADLFVTIAGNLSEELKGMFPNTRVVDVQHGVIYSRHKGYFDKNGRLVQIYRRPSMREFWLYGNGFADCFLKNKENINDLSGRVKVVGDLVRANVRPGKSRHADFPHQKLVVLVLQITSDIAIENALALVRIYEKFLDGIRLEFLRSYKFVIRHHPRFYDFIDLSNWKVKYPWLSVDDRPFLEVFPEAVCCVTINSTTVFDAASYGCPSLILDGSVAGWKNIMVDDYDYPFGRLTLDELVNMDDFQRLKLGESLNKWYNYYYTPFSEEKTLKLLRDE